MKIYYDLPNPNTLMNRSDEWLLAEMALIEVDKILQIIPPLIFKAHLDKQYFISIALTNHNNIRLDELIEDKLIKTLESYGYTVFSPKKPTDFVYCKNYELTRLKISWLYPLPESEKGLKLIPSKSQMAIIPKPKPEPEYIIAYDYNPFLCSVVQLRFST